MKRIIHHIKRHWKAIHKHIKKHHKHYIFGAISAALVYKTLALILTTVAVTPIGNSFASWNTETWVIDTWIVVSGNFFINNNDSSTTWLSVILNNNVTWATYMRFWNTESDLTISAWDSYNETKNRILDDNGTWNKTVYAEFSWTIILSLQDDILYTLPVTETWSVNTWSSSTWNNLTWDILSWTVNTWDNLTWDILTWEVETWNVFLADITPDIFDFTDIDNANLDTEYFSNTKTISGINTWTLVYINNWTFKINDWNRSNATWIVNSGDSIVISSYSSNQYDTEKTIELAIWELITNWSITTQSANNSCDSSDINLESPIGGDILKWEFGINRSFNNTDCSNEELTIKLRDANTQYITIWTANSNTTTFNFDSTLLYSGFYNMTGLDSSGNVITIYTWEYGWNNFKFFSWHKIIILNSALEVLYEWDEFTIDNQSPILSNIELELINDTGWYIWLNGEVNISFDSNEELSSESKVTILGEYANLESNNNNHYIYSIDLSTENTQWNIIYNIEFEDIAWNTWYIEGDDNIEFDKTKPELDSINFNLDNDWETINLDIKTNEDTKINFVYTLSWTNTWGSYESSYLDDHQHGIIDIKKNAIYNYTISIEDIVENILYIWWTFSLSWDTVDYSSNTIDSWNIIVDTWFEEQDEDNEDQNNDKTISTPVSTFKTEIEKFNICKDSLKNMSILEIPVRKYKVQLEMPELETNYVRKLVSAFSIVLFQRIETVWLTETEIDDITKEFNNFLVILKLVRDDGNECEQNLSNYYMSKFRKSLIEYNLVE